jgi:hypothetical protein
VIQGNVESQFIYATLLPVDMVPFGILRFRPIVLPLLPHGGHFELLRPDDARQHGYVHLARWTEQVEAEWTRRRSAKLKDTDALAWLDYRKKLTQQSPGSELWAVYAKSGTHVCACVVTRVTVEQSICSGLRPAGFIVDHAVYSLELSDGSESRYLASVLNAPSVDLRIKAAQAKGLWGAREVHKKVLDLPIPRFDSESKAHLRLAEIGQDCADRVEQWIASGGPGTTTSIGVLRRRVREMLEAELAEIDSIVGPMLGI